MGDHDKKKDKTPKYDKREESKIELSTNGRGELEASIEETNRIRASLGLKPLKIDQKKEEKPTKKNTEDKKTAELADQISQLKKKRIASKVIGKSLGELLEDEEEDAASWVTKARVLQEDQIKKDKELATQRALELEARDREIEHTSADLRGMKVAHSFDNFQDVGEGVILTLKDTNILKDANTLNEEEADLENIKISEKERLKKYIEMKKKKPIYNAYDEESNKSILPQYDEEKKETAGFTISGSGRIVSQVQLEEIRNKLNANKDKNTPQITLDTSKMLASEYMTHAEESAIKIKKTTKKKKKLRTKALDELVPEESGTKDRGSRNESSKIKAEEERESLEKEKREKSYQKAVTKAQSSIYSNKEAEEEVKGADSEIVSKLKEENEISNIIKTKQLASKTKKKESEDSILQRVQLNAKQREEQTKRQTSEDQSLVFTSTTEFVRAIQPIDIIASSLEKDKEIMEDIEEHEKMLQQANKKRKQREAEEEEAQRKEEEEKQELSKMEIVKKEAEEAEEEEDEDGTTPFEVLEDHTRSGGMAAVLRMLQHKKPSDDLMWAGRRTDEKPGIGGDKGIKLDYKDEFGRIRTPKEEFRELSHRFHGKKPGKNKQEKRQKQYEEDMKKLQVLNESTSLVQTMQSEQEKRATPYLVLGGSIKSLTTETASGLSKVGAPSKKSDTNNIASKTTATTTTVSNDNNVTTTNVIQQQTKGGELKGEFKEFKIEKKQKLQ